MDSKFEKQPPKMNEPETSGVAPNEESKEPMRLDDSQRVKVLSPGALVFKRFVRNRLAIAGVCILLTMFLFSFVAPLFYPYSQTEVFYKYDNITTNYAGITERKDFVNYTLNPSVQVSKGADMMINSDIIKLNDAGLDSMTVDHDGLYILDKLGEYCYTLSKISGQSIASFNPPYTVGTFNSLEKTMTYGNGIESLGEAFDAAVAAAVESGSDAFAFDGVNYTVTAAKKLTYTVACADASVVYAGEALGEDFETAVMAAIDSGEKSVIYDGTEYLLMATAIGGYDVTEITGADLALVSSVLVFDTESGTKLSDELRNAALLNAYNGQTFEVDGASYSVVLDEEEGSMTLVDSTGETVAAMTNLVVRDTLGGDTMSLEFKQAAEATIAEMSETGSQTGKFTFPMPKMESATDEAGNIISTPVLDESGNPVLEDTELSVIRKTGQYEVSCQQMRYLIDINASPSKTHLLGTDGNGMDNLSRMMYGGRISLMVGFVVVILETVLGVIMGGVAGYFGGWVDTLIMRLVDIFNCIPSMPILIIMAAFMDAQQVSSYVRLMYMMAILGILGWAGVARLVRGQILSLREQEFMTATEATGIRVSRRIFHHLVPNVMPQLIVTATSSLGSVILTESTLSFLGLGVKFPLATWGNIINTVTKTNENLTRYTYIWVPVGLLICLTVIAFNFVGDGLRDAFDPKMKR